MVVTREGGLVVLPGGALSRIGAVHVTITGRVLRADTAMPLRDLIHVVIRQRGFEHTWEPQLNARGAFTFEPGLLRPGATRFFVCRESFAPAMVRARVGPDPVIRLGTVRLVLNRALPGTIGVYLRTVDPVEIESLLLDGPADRAGLREFDQILAVDGNRLDSANAESVIRGPPGSVVTLRIRRVLTNDRPNRKFTKPRIMTFSVQRAKGRRSGRRHPIWRA